MKFKPTLTFALLMFFIYSSHAVYSETEKFALITGKIVNLRNSPELNGSVNGKASYGQTVDVIKISDTSTIIDNDNFNWFYIKTQNNITGWVYGKYLLLLDKKPETDKYYKDYLIKKIESRPKKEIKRKLEKFQVDRGRGIVIAEIRTGASNDPEDMDTLIFKMDGNNLIFLTTTFKEKILFFYKNYFFQIFPIADIEIFDMNIVNNNGDMFDRYLSGFTDNGYCYYKKVFRLFLGDIEKEYKISPRGNSFIEFDKNKMECIINIKKSYSKDKEQNIIDRLKYKYDEGKFIKVPN